LHDDPDIQPFQLFLINFVFIVLTTRIYTTRGTENKNNNNNLGTYNVHMVENIECEGRAVSELVRKKWLMCQMLLSGTSKGNKVSTVRSVQLRRSVTLIIVLGAKTKQKHQRM